MENTWEGAPKSVFEEITKNFMDNLAGMGYSFEWRKKVLSKALTGYMRILKKVELGQTLRNRNGASTLNKRRFNKLCGSKDWFKLADIEDENRTTEPPEYRSKSTKRMRNSKRVESVVFLPITEGSKLKQDIQNMELSANFLTRFKYIESTGISLIGSLGKLDPWETLCQCPNCFSCQSKPGKCMKTGANYTIECQNCKTNGLEVKYFGETARTPFDRGVEHLAALKNFNPESPLVEHAINDHGGVLPEFTMSISSFHPKAFERQC